jgi:hypothetical protein
MKLASLVLVALTAFSSVASADLLNPPGRADGRYNGGPVDTSDVDVDVDVRVDAPRGDRMRERRGQMRQRDPQQIAKRQRLRRVLVEQFDVNGDGRLGPRERMRAARMLRKIEQRLVTPRQGRADRRYDGQSRRGQGL